jgi:Toastrack DUF4097
MHKTFETTGPVLVELRLTSGDAVIDPSLDDRVEVELIAHDDDSQALVDAARVELVGDRLVVDVPSKQRSFGLGFAFGRRGISCRVRCPARSSVEARTKSTDLRATGTLRDVSASTASGDLALLDLEGDLTVKSASGDIEARRVAGDANVDSASGDIRLDYVGGTVNVNTASGDVRLGETISDSHVVTVSGDQHYEAVSTGNITAQAVSGDVRIAVRRGSRVFLDCSTLSGDTRSELDPTGDADTDAPAIEIRAKTVSGDITITRAPAAKRPPADSAQEVHA